MYKITQVEEGLNNKKKLTLQNKTVEWIIQYTKLKSKMHEKSMTPLN